MIVGISGTCVSESVLWGVSVCVCVEVEIEVGCFHCNSTFLLTLYIVHNLKLLAQREIGAILNNFKRSVIWEYQFYSHRLDCYLFGAFRQNEFRI